MAGRNKVKTDDGIVKVEATLMQEAMSERKPRQKYDASKDPKKQPRRKSTATAVKEQMCSVEDAADLLGLSTARVRGLIRAEVLKTERVSIAVDEGQRPRTALRIRKSVIDKFLESRKQRGAEADDRKQRKLGRTPRERLARQYIATLTPEQVAALEKRGYTVRPRFQGQRNDDAANVATA